MKFSLLLLLGALAFVFAEDAVNDETSVKIEDQFKPTAEEEAREDNPYEHRSDYSKCAKLNEDVGFFADELTGEITEEDFNVAPDVEDPKKSPKKSPKKHHHHHVHCYIWHPYCEIINGCKYCIYQREFKHPKFCHHRFLMCVKGCVDYEFKQRCKKFKKHPKLHALCKKKHAHKVKLHCIAWCSGGKPKH